MKERLHRTTDKFRILSKVILSLWVLLTNTIPLAFAIPSEIFLSPFNVQVGPIPCKIDDISPNQKKSIARATETILTHEFQDFFGSESKGTFNNIDLSVMYVEVNTHESHRRRRVLSDAAAVKHRRHGTTTITLHFQGWAFFMNEDSMPDLDEIQSVIEYSFHIHGIEMIDYADKVSDIILHDYPTTCPQDHSSHVVYGGVIFDPRIGDDREKTIDEIVEGTEAIIADGPKNKDLHKFKQEPPPSTIEILFNKDTYSTNGLIFIGVGVIIFCCASSFIGYFHYRLWIKKDCGVNSGDPHLEDVELQNHPHSDKKNVDTTIKYNPITNTATVTSHKNKIEKANNKDGEKDGRSLTKNNNNTSSEAIWILSQPLPESPRDIYVIDEEKTSSLARKDDLHNEKYKWDSIVTTDKKSNCKRDVKSKSMSNVINDKQGVHTDSKRDPTPPEPPAPNETPKDAAQQQGQSWFASMPSLPFRWDPKEEPQHNNIPETPPKPDEVFWRKPTPSDVSIGVSTLTQHSEYDFNDDESLLKPGKKRAQLLAEHSKMFMETTNEEISSSSSPCIKKSTNHRHRVAFYNNSSEDDDLIPSNNKVSLKNNKNGALTHSEEFIINLSAADRKAQRDIDDEFVMTDTRVDASRRREALKLLEQDDSNVVDDDIVELLGVDDTTGSRKEERIVDDDDKLISRGQMMALDTIKEMCDGGEMMTNVVGKEDDSCMDSLMQYL